MSPTNLPVPVSETLPIVPVSYDDIMHKGGLSHVRERPGMYVGDFLGNEYNSALMNLLREVVGNSVDEFMNGYATLIDVVYDPATNTMHVMDDGRGIPFGPTTYIDSVSKAEYPIDKLHLATGVPNTGAKYSKGDEQSFKFAIGMNGIGIKAVNALSRVFRCTSVRDGKAAQINYEFGHLANEQAVQYSAGKIVGHGTTITWTPDDTILKHTYNLDHVKRYLQEVAYLNAGLKLRLRVGELTKVVDQAGTVYCEPEGLNALAKHLVADEPILVDFPILAGTEEKGSKFEIILKVLKSGGEITHAYVNGSAIEIASAPVAAARKAYGQALTSMWKDYAKPKKHEKLDLRPDDLRSGLIAIVKILHVDPAFDSQTKTKLVNTDISSTIATTLPNLIKAHLLAHPAQLTGVFTQAVQYAEARAAAEAARARILKTQTKLSDTTPISLDIYTPPLRPNPATNSLYLMEGGSAKGSVEKAGKEKDPKSGRLYKEDVGMLALRGNVLNALETDMNTALANVELATLVKVSGLNPTDPDDLSKLKFKRFVIATDMDAGGAHISTLLLGFFITHFPKIITEGRLFRVITPLFEVQDLKTKVKHFIYPDEDRQVGVKRIGFKPEEANKKYTIKRNKGLGEMSDEANLTLVANPRLLPFQYDDIERMKQLFLVFSGEKFVEHRRELIFSLGLTKEDA